MIRLTRLRNAHYEPTDRFDGTYSHPDFPGIGLRVRGYEQFYDTDWEEWTTDPGTTRVVVTMVGDDTAYSVDAGELTEIDETCSCGQIGCGWEDV